VQGIDQPYLIQEFIDGENLEQELQHHGQFSQRQIQELLVSLLPVLTFLHDQQIVHRDIKPENIVRRRNGQLVLVDFGAAKQLTRTLLAQTATVIGSPEYTAPEQARGKTLFASDIYSLGVTSLHLLTNTSPFDLFDIAQDTWIWRNYLKDNPVDDFLGAILDRMIANALPQRYQTATEVLADLQAPATNQLQVLSEQLGEGIQLELIAIPGGDFLMGAATPKPRRVGLPSRQQVSVPAFWMSKYLITQAQWQQVAQLPLYKRRLDPNPARFQGADLPVENVCWYDALEFCARLSLHCQRPYRLPTEAEWEYACRAGTTTEYHFGEAIDWQLANYDGKHARRTTPVGSFPANAFGLHDMHGNLWEWCRDWWHENYLGIPTNGTAWIADGDQSARVLRGGSWFDNAWYCRSADRDRGQLDIVNQFIGFRVAFTE
jgi:formylglycine-generating enzyme required for sulfatase activity